MTMRPPSRDHSKYQHSSTQSRNELCGMVQVHQQPVRTRRTGPLQSVT